MTQATLGNLIAFFSSILKYVMIKLLLEVIIVRLKLHWFKSELTLGDVGLAWWLRLWRICPRFRGPRFDPWVRKIPRRKEWYPTPVFLPGKSHGQRSLAGCSPRSCKELETTEWLSMYANGIAHGKWSKMDVYCFLLVNLNLDSSARWWVSSSRHGWVLCLF